MGVRPGRRADMVAATEVEALAGRGLTGDHRARRPGSDRQVTLIQAEHLEVVGALLGQLRVDPGLTRRNLVVSGINVLALKDQVFAIGDALLEGTGPCEPCSRMEANLGLGGYNAMRGHGGITARIVVGGILRLGDTVRVRE
jgi:MOSC domain-containing protein YiiM